jgi:transposase
MSIRPQERNATNSVLFMGLELGQRTWKLGFTVGLGQKPRQREIPAGCVHAVRREIADSKKRFDLPANAEVISCYEAGRDGFWLHRWLASEHVHNLVVDSSSIQVPRRQRRVKTDRLDLAQLLTMLVRWHQGETKVWSVVTVPSEAEEDVRHLHRELETLRAEQTSHINRIKGVLIGCGVVLEVNRWLPKQLKLVRLWNGSPLPNDLRQRVLREFERMQVVNRQVRELEKERAARIRNNETDKSVAQVRKLLRVKGIGVNSAWMYVQEVFGWRKIKNRRQLGALVGLTGSPYCSGNMDRDQGITKAGNRRMRTMAVEIAWGWLAFQPGSDLSRWYQQRFAAGTKRLRRIGIVALARKLLVELWKYLETGVPPRNAELVDWDDKIHYTPCLTPA